MILSHKVRLVQAIGLVAELPLNIDELPITSSLRLDGYGYRCDSGMECTWRIN